MLENGSITENPKLVEEWDYEKDGGLHPEDCADDPRRFVWWKCASGHSWQARISDRMNGAGCPYDCGIRKFDFKPLASARPDLAAEWDYKGNDHLSPEEISAFSHIKVKWRCHKGHSFKATPSARNRGSSCLLCLKEGLGNGR